jgi:hypothetical protein
MPAFNVLDQHNLQRLVKNLEQFASEYGHRRPAGTFVLFGNSLIDQRIVERNPGLATAILDKHRQLTRVTLPVTADEVRLQRNARIYGLDRRKDVTVKVVLEQGKRTLFKEVRARRIVSSIIKDSGPIFVPRLLAYDRRGGNWLVEEFVSGRGFEKQDTRRLLAAVASGFYHQTARARPLSRLIGAGYLRERLEELDPLFPKISPESKWPVALTHGDLVRSNVLCSADGRLCLIDWELAGVRPVAIDLAQIYRSDRDLKAEILDFLRRLDPNREAMPAAAQLALGVVHISRYIWQDRNAYARVLRGKYSMSYQAALDLANSDYRAVKDYVANLRSP